MATIKLGTTKAGSRLMNYAEKRAEQKQGVNCPAAYAKAQMKATRELWGKNDGIQAHHVIQSFKPEETNAEQANEIGKQLAEKIAPGHECSVYTHADKEHIHNHIVINSVNFESGHKYQAHGKKAIEDIRDASDQICLEHELSVIKEPSAEIRYTLAEQALWEKKQDSWKDEIRLAVDVAKNNVPNFDGLKNDLERDYGIETKLRGKTLSFKHPDQQRFVRANKLGANYEMEGLQRGFERQIRAGQEYERTVERNPGTKQDHDELYSSTDERGHSERLNDRQPVRANQEYQRGHHEQHEFHLAEAERAARKKQERLAAGFDRWTEKYAREQRQDNREVNGTGKEQSKQVKQHERGNEQEHEQDREQHKKPRGRHKERDEGLSL